MALGMGSVYFLGVALVTVLKQGRLGLTIKTKQKILKELTIFLEHKSLTFRLFAIINN
jgi:hypothetical protein